MEHTGQESAREAGLHYATDRGKGYTRIGQAPRFRYADVNGKRVRDRATLARIRGLVLPPAWTNVWIAADPLAHLQATGRDARGRKQYRYHAKFREVREATKFDRLPEFAAALPAIRRALKRDLTRRRCRAHGARDGGAAPRADTDPRRQRRVRARQQVATA